MSASAISLQVGENWPLQLSKLFICTFPNVESGLLSLIATFNICDLYVTVTCSCPRFSWILVLLPPWCTKIWGLHWSSTSRTTIIYWPILQEVQQPPIIMCRPINVIFWQFQFLSNAKFPVVYRHWKNSRSRNHIICIKLLSEWKQLAKLRNSI